MILSAGLTPAWQHVLLFDSFTPGEVNRARAVHQCASGKVLNAARALHHLDAPVGALTVVGGTTGEQIRRDVAQLGIAARWVESSMPTRLCTTILDAARRHATELVPNAGELRDAERDNFLTAYTEEAARAAVVILIGSLPTGTPSAFYRTLLERTPRKAILDARGPELLEALTARPFLVKPNRDELRRTLGRDLPGETELFDAMRELNDRGAEWVVITSGTAPVYASNHGHVYRFLPPQRDVVNPIGCGDCMAAGIAWAIFQGREPVTAIRLGMAAAADKVTRPLPGLVDRTSVEALTRDIQVKQM